MTSTVVENAGLFVSLEFGGLAASPDALVGTNGILEIKCPYIERNLLPTAVADRKKGKFIIRTNGPNGPEYHLLKTHHYYKQVVMQLHITGRDFCDVVVWTQGGTTSDATQEEIPIVPEGHILIIRVMRNDETLKVWERMREKLTIFFNEDLGPEIVDSRYERNLGYRQPPYRFAAIEAAAAKKAEKAGASTTMEPHKKQVDTPNLCGGYGRRRITGRLTGTKITGTNYNGTGIIPSGGPAFNEHIRMEPKIMLTERCSFITLSICI